jgi:hypothetical protein
VSLAERARDRALHIAGFIGLVDGAERDVLLSEMLASWRDAVRLFGEIERRAQPPRRGYRRRTYL